MLLAIAILSGINYIFSFINHLLNNKLDVNLLTAIILVLSVWHSCLPLAIIVIVLTIFIGVMSLIFKS